MKDRIFIKIGGSYITDKTRPESLNKSRIRKLAAILIEVVKKRSLDLVLAHGAGAYGHIKAKKYNAQTGVQPHHGWNVFHEIRNDMARMNLSFVALCAEQGLHPITIQPSAIITAENGSLKNINQTVICNLLNLNQIPLLHGDIVSDKNQGFTIASTEEILAILSKQLNFQRVIMISDVPGVLDETGNIIPLISEKNHEHVLQHLGGAKGADVTGGMKGKVDRLYSLVRNGRINAARIVSGDIEKSELIKVITGDSEAGTMII